MRNVIYGATFAAATLFLAACSGGSSSGTPTTQEIEETIGQIATTANSQITVEKVYQGHPPHWYRLVDLEHVRIPGAFRNRGIRRGISLAASHERDRPFPGERTDDFALGGWLEHSYLIVERAQIFFDDPAEDDHLEVFANSIGYAPGTNPVSGSAAWQGVVVGYDLSTSAGALIEGDATIAMSFARSTIDIVFTRLQGRPNMIWTDLQVVDGVFQDTALWGQFYGPNHEEAGGVFYRDQIAGAFGAVRQ